ncbi:RNA binding protein [Coprinopsis sp. MPI-PUGE-AT-0042]|nr:RNA binding protein [Coprinopsis sp. MPI-PUGE-AT-0042]
MAKDAASKQLKGKKSSEGLLAKVKKTEKAAEPAPAPATTSKAETKKSLKRKKDETKAALEDAALEVEAPSPKKTKVVESEVTVKEKKGKKAPVVVEKVVVKETTTTNPAKAQEKQLPFPKKDKHAAPTKITNSRKKQKDPRPLAPAVEESDEDDEEEVSDVEDVPKVTKPKAKEVKKAGKKESKKQESEDEAENSSEDEENMHLHGFSTDEDSSDDEGAMDQDEGGFDVGKLPTVAKDDATVKARLEKAKKKPTEDRGVLFLGRVPHGFFEDQMKAYFSQFGEVTRVRLSRNKKTGKSKHYGFIEFDSSSVAKIVSETMDNYLLNGHLLQCKIIPKDEVHPQLWVGANRKWRPVPSGRLAMAKHNKPRDKETQEAIAKRLVKRDNKRKRKLEQVGISYDFDPVSYKKTKASEIVAVA